MNWVQKFDRFLDNVQYILMSVLVKLGPFFVAAMPALFIWWALFSVALKEMAKWTDEPVIIVGLALLFGLIPAIGIETVGIVGIHTASELYDANQEGKVGKGKFQLMVAVIPFYVLGVAGVIWFTEDAFSDTMRLVGTASPFLTAMVYTAVALNRTLQKIRLTEEAQEIKQTTKDKIEEEALRQNVADNSYERRLRLQTELEIAKDKAVAEQRTKADLKLRRLELKHAKKESGEPTLSKEESKVRFLELLQKNPDATIQSLADMMGVSRTTIYNYQKELIAERKLDVDGKLIDFAEEVEF